MQRPIPPPRNLRLTPAQKRGAIGWQSQSPSNMTDQFAGIVTLKTSNQEQGPPATQQPFCFAKTPKRGQPLSFEYFRGKFLEINVLRYIATPKSLIPEILEEVD